MFARLLYKPALFGSFSSSAFIAFSSGEFNLMLNLKKLDLSSNEIEKIENNAFLVEPYETNLLELRFSENRLKKINSLQLNGLIKLKLYFSAQIRSYYNKKTSLAVSQLKINYHIYIITQTTI